MGQIEQKVRLKIPGLMLRKDFLLSFVFFSNILKRDRKGGNIYSILLVLWQESVTIMVQYYVVYNKTVLPDFWSFFGLVFTGLGLLRSSTQFKILQSAVQFYITI